MPNLILIFKITICLFLGRDEVTFQKVQSFMFKSKPVVVYKSSFANSEIVYKIILYSNTNKDVPEKTLLVRKADQEVKNLIGANYILSEAQLNGQYINYPYGWETMNVTMTDLQEDCLNVFGKKVSPLKLN